jgi:D-xylose transport system substrate-binding protein
MRRTLSLLLVVVTAFAARTASAKAAKDVKIGVSMPTLQEERWKKDEAMIKSKLLELGVQEKNILIQSADGDEQKQLAQSENLITQGIDVLIIIPQNGEAVAPMVKSAHEAGVKVVAVDRIIKNADLDFYVTFDAYEIGVIQAEYITKVKKATSGNWIMVGGAPTDPNAALIRNGQLSILKPFIDKGQIKVVLDQPANYWNPADALKVTEAGLTKANNDVQVVFTSNDGCAGAAIQALKEQGLAGKVPVPGLDADLDAMRRIVQGTQSMTVYRKLHMQASYAAQAAFALATGSDVGKALGVKVATKNNGFKDVPSIMLKSRDVMFAVDAANLKVVVDDGWLKADDIFGNIDKKLWPAWYKK